MFQCVAHLITDVYFCRLPLSLHCEVLTRVVQPRVFSTTNATHSYCVRAPYLPHHFIYYTLRAERVRRASSKVVRVRSRSVGPLASEGRATRRHRDAAHFTTIDAAMCSAASAPAIDSFSATKREKLSAKFLREIALWPLIAPAC